MGKAGGWLSAGVLFVAAMGAFMWGVGQKRLADDLNTRLAAANKNSALLEQNLAEMGARVDAATREVQDLESRVEAMPQMDPGEAAAARPSETGQNNEAMEAMLRAFQEQPEAQGGGENPLAAMFSGEQGKNLARMSAQTTVPAMYGALFTELNLPAEAEAKVRDMLVDAIAEQVTQGMDAMNKKGDPEAMRQNMEARGQKLRAELATVLTADELAVFDEYEANKERRMLESGIEVQLTMFASGLTEENRTMFRDVIVEELTAQGQWVDNPDVYANPGGAIDRQMEAFRAARDRVAPVLDAGQAAHADAFVHQMETMMNAQREFLENLMNREKPLETPPPPEPPGQ